jgi:polyisoprenoid-binding protein YceI
MNKNIISFLILFALIFSSVTINAQKSTKAAALKKLSVNTTDSKVNWIGKKPAGEHTGYVKFSGGEIVLNKNEITGGFFIIDLKSITDLDLKDEGMNSKLVGHLKSADFFDVEKYPTAKFVITKVIKHPGLAAGVATATHKIEGDLTMKGITKKVRFDTSINILNGKLMATTSLFTINRTDWNVNYQSKSIFAELKDQFIYDDLTLSIELISN